MQASLNAQMAMEKPTSLCYAHATMDTSLLIVIVRINIATDFVFEWIILC